MNAKAVLDVAGTAGQATSQDVLLRRPSSVDPLNGAASTRDTGRDRYVNGPVITKLGLSRPRTPPRWDEARKWELLAQVAVGKLSIPAACARHRMRQEDVQQWLRGFRRAALAAFDEQLTRALIRQGATPEALQGPEISVPLGDVTIADWLQAVQLFARHAVITVIHDDMESRLWCSKGALIDAESGPLSGEAAVYRIVALEHGQVVTELRAVQRERTIATSMQGLLLEAARRKDESVLLRRRLGNLERRFQAKVPASPPPLDAAEASLLRLFEEPLRLRDAMDRTELGEAESVAALESLMRAGLLAELRPDPDSVRPAGAVASEPARDGAVRTLPISFVWQSEKERRQARTRWVFSTLMMAVLVSLAAWLGATVSTAGSSPVPLGDAARPSVPPSGSAPTPEPESYSVAVRAYPAEAALEVDGARVGTGYWSGRVRRDGVLHELRITAPGFVPARILFVDTAPPLDVHLDPLPAPPASGPTEPAKEQEKAEGTEPGEARTAGATAPGARPPAGAAEATEADASESEASERPTPTRRLRGPRAEPPGAGRRAPKAVPKKRRPYVQIIEAEAPPAPRD